MEARRIVIEHMPGPMVWEFLLQWGGLTVQTVAAIATLWAVVVALKSNQTMYLREDKRRAERASFALAAIKPELKTLRNRLVELLVHLSETKHRFDERRSEGVPYAPAAHVINSFNSTPVSLATPLMTGMRKELVDLQGDLAIDAVTTETSLPQIVEWLQILGRMEGPWFDPALGALAEVVAKRICDVGCRIDRLLALDGVGPVDDFFTRYRDTGSTRPPV